MVLTCSSGCSETFPPQPTSPRCTAHHVKTQAAHTGGDTGAKDLSGRQGGAEGPNPTDQSLCKVSWQSMRTCALFRGGISWHHLWPNSLFWGWERTWGQEQRARQQPTFQERAKYFHGELQALGSEQGYPRVPNPEHRGLLRSQGHQGPRPVYHCSSGAAFLLQPPPPHPPQRAPVSLAPLPPLHTTPTTEFPALQGPIRPGSSGKGVSTLPPSAEWSQDERHKAGRERAGLLLPTLPDLLRAWCCPSPSCQQELSLERLVKCEVSWTSGRQWNTPLQTCCTSQLSPPSGDTSSDHWAEGGPQLPSALLQCDGDHKGCDLSCLWRSPVLVPELPKSSAC